MKTVKSKLIDLGILRYSPLFYGWYGNQAKSRTGYETPQAYFIVMMVVYIFSFIIILRKMQSNSKQSKLSEKADEATFTWKVFCSWDYGEEILFTGLTKNI